MSPIDTQVFIMNAPPKSGKDTVVDIFSEKCISIANSGLIKLDHYQTASFKAELIKIALAVSCVDPEVWDSRYKTQKEEPWDALGGLSQRQYLIKISEEWVKPVHGEDHFGQAVATYIENGDKEFFSADNLYGDWDPNHMRSLVLIPDGGFPEEIIPLQEKFGAENIHIFQWERDGCSFAEDSRDYIETAPTTTHWLGENNGSIADFWDVVIDKIREVLSTKEGWT